MSNRAVVYRTASNYEGKACRELQRLGVNAIAPWDESGERAKITAPGYVFAQRAVSHAFLRHVKGKPLGTANVADVANLYVMKPPPPPKEKPYEVGDVIRVQAGVFGGQCGPLERRSAKASWLVNLGTARVSVHITNMVRIDPG